jgi:hypothetical protein
VSDAETPFYPASQPAGAPHAHVPITSHPSHHGNTRSPPVSSPQAAGETALQDVGPDGIDKAGTLKVELSIADGGWWGRKQGALLIGLKSRSNTSQYNNPFSIDHCQVDQPPHKSRDIPRSSRLAPPAPQPSAARTTRPPPTTSPHFSTTRTPNRKIHHVMPRAWTSTRSTRSCFMRRVTQAQPPPPPPRRSSGAPAAVPKRTCRGAHSYSTSHQMCCILDAPHAHKATSASWLHRPMEVRAEAEAEGEGGC